MLSRYLHFCNRNLIIQAVILVLEIIAFVWITSRWKWHSFLLFLTLYLFYFFFDCFLLYLDLIWYSGIIHFSLIWICWILRIIFLSDSVVILWSLLLNSINVNLVVFILSNVTKSLIGLYTFSLGVFLVVQLDDVLIFFVFLVLLLSPAK